MKRLGLLLALIFAVAAIARLSINSDLINDKSVREVAQAEVRDDSGIRTINLDSPFMRSER